MEVKSNKLYDYRYIENLDELKEDCEKLTLKELSKKYNIKYNTLVDRIYYQKLSRFDSIRINKIINVKGRKFYIPISIDNKTKYLTVKEYAKDLGITEICVYKRIERGWTLEMLEYQYKKNRIKINKS